jgi:Protein of unknown function (DUF742)
MTMSSEGSEGEGTGGSPEPTIADVMNAFSLDSGRKPKRRRWGRHRPEDAGYEPRSEQAHRPGGADGGYADDLYTERYAGDHFSGDRYSGDRSFGTPSFDHNDFRGPEPGEQRHRDEWDDVDNDIDNGGGSTFVRPYAWTRGRTRTGYSLEIETLVTTSQRGREQLALLQLEHRAVADLCQQARSVAEVAALLKVPLGVAKVLVGDMAGIGLVAVHESVGTHGDIPDLALMERVLSGLRRL